MPRAFGQAESLTPGAIGYIVTGYTREAGLRNLEREIANICRGVAKNVALAEGKVKPSVITDREVEKYIGPVRFPPEIPFHDPTPGVVTGLAWTGAEARCLLWRRPG